MRIAREHDLFAVAIVLDTPEATLPGAQRHASGPRLRRARHPPPDARPAPLAALPAEGGLPLHAASSSPSDEVEIVRSPLWTDRAHELGPFDIIGDVHGCYDELRRRCWPARLRRRRCTRRAAGASSSATTCDRGPETPEVLRSVMRMGRGHAICRARATTTSSSLRKLAGKRRADHARARASRSSSSRPSPMRRPARVPRGPHQPRRARRRAARRRPRRACPSATRAAARAGCARSPCSARRRGRPTSSACRSAALGGRLPRPRDRRLRPHAGRRARVGQQHDQHRHRLRVRRRADRAALARARAGVACPPPASYYAPARPFLDAGAERPARTARPRRRRRQADRPDAPGAHGDDPRGARRGRAGGHEPLRGRPALARLPAADDGADRDLAARGRARAPRRGVRRVPRRGRRARSCARRSTWARGRSWSSAATRRRRSASASRAPARSTRAPAARSSTTPSPRWRASAPPRPRAGLWERLETGWLVLDCELLPWSAKAQELIDRQYARRRRGRHRRAGRERRRARAGGRARARRGALLDRTRGRARRACSATAPPTGLPLAGQRPRGPAARAVPRARRRVAARSPTATTPGTSSTATRSPPPTPTGSSAPTAASSTSPTAREADGDRVVGDDDRRGGEGMVVKPLAFTARGRKGLVAARHQGAAAASTCGSSTAPSTTRPTRSTACARAPRPQALDGVARVRARASRRSSASSAASRCTACTSASSRVLALESEPVDPRL